MTFTMTINNADSSLIDAVKSIVRLVPKATVSFEEAYPFEDELLEDRAEIRAKIKDGSLNTYSGMEEYKKAHAL